MVLAGQPHKFFVSASLCLLLLFAFASPLSGRPAKHVSRVIVGAKVADGTGRPLRRTNVSIAGDRITRIGNFRPRADEPVIRADGLVLAPGFIDIHNHSTEGLAKDPLAESQISQDITTVKLGVGGAPRCLATFWVSGDNGTFRWWGPTQSWSGGKMADRLADFEDFRADLNGEILDCGHLGIKRFYALDHQAYPDGALPAKTKELLGLVASTVLRCDDCITYHLTRCGAEGWKREEVIDALNVALIVGGSITIPHVRRAFARMREIEALKP